MNQHIVTIYGPGTSGFGLFRGPNDCNMGAVVNTQGISFAWSAIPTAPRECANPKPSSP